MSKRSTARPEGIEPPALGFEGRSPRKSDGAAGGITPAQQDVNRAVANAHDATWDAIARRLERIEAWKALGVPHDTAFIADGRLAVAERALSGFRLAKASIDIGRWMASHIPAHLRIPAQVN